jgi:hypothetical protein
MRDPKTPEEVRGEVDQLIAEFFTPVAEQRHHTARVATDDFEAGAKLWTAPTRRPIAVPAASIGRPRRK